MRYWKGSAGADVLRGGRDEVNELWGHGGGDDLGGGKRDDFLIGGKGDDRMWGDRGVDLLIGDSGDDVGFGSVDHDALYGGSGNDRLYGGKHDDAVFGGKDHDVLHGNTGNDTLGGGSGDDALHGEAGEDALFGGEGNDWVSAGSGDDFVIVSSGTDALSGDAGFDTLDFSTMRGALDLDLSKGVYKIGSGHAWHTGTIAGFEQIFLSDGGARVMGSDRHGTVIDGGAGDDWIRSKQGADVLAGGAGADTFAYLKKDTFDGSVDTITDFQVGIDHLDLSDFLKGGRSADTAIRFEASNAGTVVQGLVGGKWVDVVVLAGIDHTQVDHSLLS